MQQLQWFQIGLFPFCCVGLVLGFGSETKKKSFHPGDRMLLVVKRDEPVWWGQIFIQWDRWWEGARRGFSSLLSSSSLRGKSQSEAMSRMIDIALRKTQLNTMSYTNCLSLYFKLKNESLITDWIITLNVYDIGNFSIITFVQKSSENSENWTKGGVFAWIVLFDRHYKTQKYSVYYHKWHRKASEKLKYLKYSWNYSFLTIN